MSAEDDGTLVNDENPELVKDDEGLWQPEGGLVEDVTRPPKPQVVPVKLGTSSAHAYKEVLPFDSFALSDEGANVKLYFGLKGAKSLLGPDSVTATFRVQALEVVAKVNDALSYRCHESILYEHIVPEKCKVKVKTDHILVTMPKAHQTHWQDLGVNRKAIGPVRKSPPDFGKPIIVTTGGTASSS